MRFILPVLLMLLAAPLYLVLGSAWTAVIAVVLGAKLLNDCLES